MNWEIIGVTLIVFIAVVVGMSVGVIFSNRRIKGSCGGIKMVMGDDAGACEICEHKDKCEKEINESC